MKLLRTILWIQLTLGLVGGYVALANIHLGAVSAAWVYNLQVEYDKMKQSPGYIEPSPIRDQSFSKILGDMRAYGHARADVAFYWLVTCGALVLLAVVMLWLLRRETANKGIHRAPR